MTDPRHDDSDPGVWHDECWPQMFPDEAERDSSVDDCADWFPECRSD